MDNEQIKNFYLMLKTPSLIMNISTKCIYGMTLKSEAMPFKKSSHTLCGIDPWQLQWFVRLHTFQWYMEPVKVDGT